MTSSRLISDSDINKRSYTKKVSADVVGGGKRLGGNGNYRLRLSRQAGEIRAKRLVGKNTERQCAAARGI